MFTREEEPSEESEEEPSEESEEAERAQPLVFVSPSAAQTRRAGTCQCARFGRTRAERSLSRSPGTDGRERGPRSRGGPQRGSAVAGTTG